MSRNTNCNAVCLLTEWEYVIFLGLMMETDSVSKTFCLKEPKGMENIQDSSCVHCNIHRQEHLSLVHSMVVNKICHLNI
jgi:hypothetical protein